jgi:hypothetical protein
MDLNLADTLNGVPGLDSARMLRVIAEAAGDVGSKIGMEKAKNVTMASGTNAYLLDVHLSDARAAAVVKNYSLYPIGVVSFEEFKNLLSASSIASDSLPKFCAVHGDSIYFQPVPQYTGTVKVWYWARGKVLATQSDTCDLPYELYPAVEYYAAMRAAGIMRADANQKMYGDMYAQEVVYYRALYGRDNGKTSK